MLSSLAAQMAEEESPIEEQVALPAPPSDEVSDFEHSPDNDDEAPWVRAPVEPELGTVSEDEQQPNAETSLQDIRGSWQFACVIQFCRMFAAPLKLKNFSADFLEKALMAPRDYELFLSELLYKLLRPDATLPFIERDAENWQRMLRERVSGQWPDSFDKNPLRRKDFLDVSPMMRVQYCLLCVQCRQRHLSVFD